MFIIKAIVKFFAAIILAKFTNWLGWFIVGKGEGILFLFFLACFIAWPLVKWFAAKHKAAGQKLHRSFSDMACSVMNMVRSWADRHTPPASSEKETIPDQDLPDRDEELPQKESFSD